MRVHCTFDVAEFRHFKKVFFSCGSLAQCISKSPDLRFLILFGSPATLMIVLCFKKEKEKN